MKEKFVIFALDTILAESSNKYYHARTLCNCGLPLIQSGHEDYLNLKVYTYYQFFKHRGYKIAVFTSRDDKYRMRTEKWFQKNNIQYDCIEMRASGDYRPSYLVKEEFLKTNFLENTNCTIQAVFESDESCIEMYRRNKIRKIYDCKT